MQVQAERLALGDASGKADWSPRSFRTTGVLGQLSTCCCTWDALGPCVFQKPHQLSKHRGRLVSLDLATISWIMTQATKTALDTLDFVKGKNCLREHLSSERGEKAATEWGNTSANHVSDRDDLPEYIKNSDSSTTTKAPPD